MHSVVKCTTSSKKHMRFSEGATGDNILTR
jgi:hypothetical protein